MVLLVVIVEIIRIAGNGVSLGDIGEILVF